MSDHREQDIKLFLSTTLEELVEESIVDLNDDLLLYDYIDSIVLVNLMIVIEEKFDILYEPHEIGLENFKSIQTITEIIDEKLSLNKFDLEEIK